jgi:hypothetical protein
MARLTRQQALPPIGCGPAVTADPHLQACRPMPLIPLRSNTVNEKLINFEGIGVTLSKIRVAMPWRNGIPDISAR